MQSPWYIVGAGSIGCLFAAYLRRAGTPVVLVLRDDAALAQWRRHGTLQLQHGPHIDTIAVPACTATQLPAAVQRVLLCTKAHQTEAALIAIQHALADDAALVLLQNGMGVRERLQPLAPRAAILHALSTEGAYQPERFHIVHAGRGSTALGAVPAQQMPLAAELAATLRCELEISAVPDIATRLWLKLAVNSVINPLTALHECRNGELLQLPDIAAEVTGLCDELSAVATAAGTALTSADLCVAVFDVMRRTAANRSSMLQDIEQRRRTEIDFINGYVVRTGRELALPCPRHQALWNGVKEKEIRLRCR